MKVERRRQKSEIRGQKSEGGGQKTEDCGMIKDERRTFGTMIDEG